MEEAWPHAPARIAIHPGAYIVTAATLDGELIFRDRESLDGLQRIVRDTYAEAGWNLQAWAFFPNHYHVVILHDDPPESLRRVIAKAHVLSAKMANSRAGTSGRQVWFRYWGHSAHVREILSRSSRLCARQSPAARRRIGFPALSLVFDVLVL